MELFPQYSPETQRIQGVSYLIYLAASVIRAGGTTLAISPVNPMRINLGTLLVGPMARRERAQATFPAYIESLSDLTGNAVSSYVLDHADHVHGGQVQDVRIH